MKIEKVLNLINENVVIDFGHFHFDSAASFLNRYCAEDEEFEPDTWGEETFEKCKKDKDFVEYDEAKKLYDKLSRKEQKFVSPNGKYKDSPKLVFRLGEHDKNNLIGFIDVYYFPKEKKSLSDVDELIDDISSSKSFDGRDGFITMAVDPKYRGKGIAKKLLAAAAKKAKEVGLDALTYEVEYKNKPSINFIQKFSSKFKNETPAPKSDKDSGTLIFRYRFEKDEDEMTSAILSTAPQGGALECGDNYVPADMRTPKVLGKIQKRKKDEDSEDISSSILYRYMSVSELEDILTYNAFKNLINFFDDSEGLRKNPAGQLPFFKSFTTKITQEALNDFMGPDHIIVLFDAKALAKSSTKFSKCKLLPYTFDDEDGAIHEYEYRLFSEQDKVPINPKKAIKGVIFCPEGGKISPEEKEEILLNLDYAGVDMHKQGKVQVIRSWKPLRRHFIWLSEDDTILSTK